jgi:hypothetical protein
MTRWTKKLIAKQLAWTDECFLAALHERYWNVLSEAEREMELLDLKRLIELDWREEVRTPEINDIYIRNLIKLETEKLELIVEAYQKGKQYRSGATIERIMTELLERAVNSETKEIT